MGIRKQHPQARTGLVLVTALVAVLFLTPHHVMADGERGVSQDDPLELPGDTPALLAEVVVTDEGGFELYSVHASTDDHTLIAELTTEDIDAAKALAEVLGQGVQIVPLEDDEVSAQLALRLPQLFAVTASQCALMGYTPDGKTGTVFFDC